MKNITTILLVPVLLLVLLFPLLLVRGDAVTAKFLVERGRASLEEDDVPAARGHFEKALAEEERYLPAILGLAEVAIREGDKEAAGRHLTMLTRQDGQKGLTGDEQKAVEAAAGIFHEFDPVQYEFVKMMGGFEQRMIALAKKHAKQDPNLARLCLSKVLAVSPDHSEAQNMLDALGLAAELWPDARRLDLLAKNLGDWSHEKTIWSVEGQWIRAKPGPGSFVATHEDKVGGDFAVLADIRIVEDTGDVPKCGLMVGWVGYSDFYSLQIVKGYFLFCVRNPDRSTTLVQKDWATECPDFDPSKWNSFAIIVKGGMAKVFVNSKELLRYTATPARPFDGYVGLFAQHQTYNVRKFVLLK